MAVGGWKREKVLNAIPNPNANPKLIPLSSCSLHLTSRIRVEMSAMQVGLDTAARN